MRAYARYDGGGPWAAATPWSRRAGDGEFFFFFASRPPNSFRSVLLLSLFFARPDARRFRPRNPRLLAAVHGNW